MYIATFGPKGFTVSLEKIVSFDELEISSSLNTEKLDNEGKKPSTYIKGSNLDSLNFKVTVDKNFGTTPEIQYKQWIEVLKKQQPWPLLIQGKPLNNTKYLLIKVQPINSKFDNKGNWITTTIYLEFEEFVAEGKPVEEATVSTSAIAVNSNASSEPSTSVVYQALKPKEKSLLTIDSKTSRTYRNPALELSKLQLGGSNAV